ncbi:SMR family transporter [Rhodococcus sp. HNM0569]|uniref:DMT family transporter n=1 Tax=Rhodococcus sp. HNM0569 TaxID=2716340 RepID=UPI00146DE9E6|nr:SMR family transporter [Rhodococcus sp. HNM0569]NLU83642.1 QacE family quaternary ammonium compound efflux SMR transporter [Rhodococcus sp. HNM0569]
MRRIRASGTTKWGLLALAIVCEVTATLSLRQSLDHPAWLVVVVTGYAGAFVALALVLRTGVPIGVAYGVWAAIGVAATAVLAAVLFDDPLTVQIGIGIALVIVGVLLVELGSHPPGTEPLDAPERDVS